MYNGSITANAVTPSVNMKNRIINGAMVIDQRNAGALVNPAVTGTYYLDRWQVSSTVASKFSIGQDAGAVTPPVGFNDYLGVTSLSAYTVGAAETFSVQQRIEGYNIADLGFGTANAKTITLSFWVRSSLTGTFGGSLKNSASDRSYPYSYTISAANTWEQKSVTIAGDTTGTWLTTNGNGISVFFSLGTGSTLSGTAGAWAATNYTGVTGATSVVGTNGATFYITGVQLEVGSTATSFDYRPYGTEFQLCQRYFQTYTASAQEWIYNEGNGATAKFWQSYIYTRMRATPTVSLEGTWTGGTVTGLSGTISSIPDTWITASRVSYRVTMSTASGTAYNLHHTDSFNGLRVLYSSEL
jgi:hypothetical protein